MEVSRPGRPRRLGLLAVGLAAALVACESTSPEDPLARTVALIPPDDAGAALVELVGAAVTAVTTPEGEVFFHAGGDTTRIVVIRTEPGAVTFDFRVVDPSASPVAKVLQVADGENRLRDPSAYRLEVGR